MNAIPIGTRVRITTGLKTYGMTGEIVSHVAPKHGTSTQRLNLLAHRVVLDKGGSGEYDPRELEVVPR